MSVHVTWCILYQARTMVISSNMTRKLSNINVWWNYVTNTMKRHAQLCVMSSCKSHIVLLPVALWYKATHTNRMILSLHVAIHYSLLVLGDGIC